MYTTKLFSLRNLFLFACVLFINACGEFTYKQGATPRDLEIAKKNCNAAGGETAAEECLKKNGWTVKKLDDLDLFAIPSVNIDNRTSSKSKPKLPDNIKESGKNTTPSATADEEIPDKQGTVTQKSPPQKVEHAPDEIFSIGSWWKIGGGDAQLRADINQCVTSLGEQYRPNIAKQEYSYALIVCLHDKGWKALVNVK